ncbi:MAG: methylated-DNA--[protein]-cysteine S-methyltransferase [Moraxellaceae bacterium]|jgi:methylated-DNA-[protein]-cysteine S-methyltransferase|nr:methylated-DNA--[protein]-cysteine S-methyltransferase [Moraxellaceae bacterium]
MNPPLYFDVISSPLGVLLVAHCSGYLCALDFQDYESRFRQVLARRFGNVPIEQRPAPEAIRVPLDAYLSGASMEALTDIPVHAPGTRFQQQVWKALRRIPAGKLWSYGDLARAIGLPGSAKAVAQAVARNPVAIIVPCHRLADSDGRIASYTGGLARKIWLLAHEGVAGIDRHLEAVLPAFLGGQAAQGGAPGS